MYTLSIICNSRKFKVFVVIIVIINYFNDTMSENEGD